MKLSYNPQDANPVSGVKPIISDLKYVLEFKIFRLPMALLTVKYSQGLLLGSTLHHYHIGSLLIRYHIFS